MKLSKKLLLALLTTLLLGLFFPQHFTMPVEEAPPIKINPLEFVNEGEGA